MYNIGDKVKVRKDNDNDGYDSFRDKVLIVTHIAESREEHPGYDESMRPMYLYDFKDLEGNPIGCSLYDYEITRA